MRLRTLSVSVPLCRINEHFSAALHEVERLLLPTEDTRVLTRGVAGVVGLRFASRVLTFVIGLILARTLGPSSYGTYIFAITWLAFLVVPATLGMDYVLLRFVAAYQGQCRWPDLKGLLRFANVVTLVPTGLVALGALVVVGGLGGIDPVLRRTLWIIIALLPLVVYTQVWQAVLRGLQHVVQSQMPEAIVQPVILLASVVAGLLLVGKPSNAPELALLHAVAVGAAFVAAAVLLIKARPAGLQGVTPSYECRAWLAMVPPLVFIGGVQIILNRVDILMLGSLGSASDVGTYAVASRIAEIVLFMMDATVLAGAPMVASLYATGNRRELQRIISLVARLNVGLGAPICLVLFLGAPWFLGFFGDEFVTAQNALRVLIVAHLLSAATGLGAQTLYMTGYQRDAALIMAASAGINVALNATLIPRFGILGAAIATGTSLVLFRLAVAATIYRRLGIVSTVHDFGKFRG